MKRATVGIYGVRSTGFAFLYDLEGEAKVYGNHNGLVFPHETATEALFAACSELEARGVDLVRVSFDTKINGRTVVKYADLSPASPQVFGSIDWKVA